MAAAAGDDEAMFSNPLVCLSIILGCVLVATAVSAAPDAVKRTEKSVWIEGVRNIEFRQTPTSVMGSLAEALRVLGEPVSYEYLMGASGAAFRMQVHEDGMCP